MIENTDVGTDGVMSHTFEDQLKLNEVPDASIVDYWTGRICMAMFKGPEAIRDQLWLFFNKMHTETFDNAFAYGVEIGTETARQKASVSRRKTRTLSKRTTRKTKISRKTKTNKGRNRK